MGRTGRTRMPRGFGGPTDMTVRRRSASAFTVIVNRFENPVYASSVWTATSSTGTGLLYSDGEGETRTGALWVQDAWKIEPNLKLTLGGRLETWEALDGFNLNTSVNST